MKTLVLGLGNPILSDDGIGVLIAESVRAQLSPDTAIEISEASVGGLELMERMLGYQRVILIDALHGNGYCNPGAIHKLTLDSLRAVSPTQHSSSAHDTSLVTAWDMARQMGLSLPDEVIIYGIEVKNIIDFGDKLTPAVTAAVPEVTAAVLRDLGNG